MMIKFAPILILTPLLFNICLAKDSSLYDLNQVLMNRAELSVQLQQNIDDEMQESEKGNGAQKSIARSVLYSAVVPGLGQFYTGSYIKAGLFAAVEITSWVVNIHYNSLGDDKDAEYRGFANNNWSEQRYWSYVYYRVKGDPDFNLDPSNFIIDDSNPDKPIIVNWQDVEGDLEHYANGEYISGFTHTLPATKTQQYYEMIGKYPEQFGNAWADANFNTTYSGFNNRVTPMNDRYTNLSKESERLYDKAGYGSMVALINHVLSAVDAGFTTRGYNRRQLRLSYDNRRFNGEYVNMFGIEFGW
jgi:hypothetical protein